MVKCEASVDGLVPYVRDESLAEVAAHLPYVCSSLKRGKLRLQQPVEAFVKTGDRTVMSYLMKPLSDQINRAFRE
jgi:hypothetical protein